MFGHPTGLFTLFFAELWERFSYYGMRALLVFYLVKGFMGYGDDVAYRIYGAYTALVYMTPFFGGLIADRLIGARRAVILGGLLMAGGHLLMADESKLGFFTALALLIVGNGFFKPNISSMVGSLYPGGSVKRNGGFTIFYIGINLGACIAPLLCGYIGETYGWHKGFGLATIGMLAGLAVFVAPAFISQLLLLFSCLAISVNIVGIDVIMSWIYNDPSAELLEFSLRYAKFLPSLAAILMVIAGLLALAGLNYRQNNNTLANNRLADAMTILLIMASAIGFAVALVMFHPNEFWSKSVFYLLAGVLVIAAVISSIAVSKSGLPAWVGLPSNFEGMKTSSFNIGKDWLVYAGALASVPVFMLLVSGFEPINEIAGGMTVIDGEYLKKWSESDSTFQVILATMAKDVSTPAGIVLVLAGIVAVSYLVLQMLTLQTIARHRMYVVMILTFFSMLFWAFFEQAGSSLNNFADRNVTRTSNPIRMIGDDDIGESIVLRLPTEINNQDLADYPILSQSFLGRSNADPNWKTFVAAAMRQAELGKPVANQKSDQDLEALISVVTEGKLNLTVLNYLRDYSKLESNQAATDAQLINWTFAQDNVGLEISYSEIPASVLQAVNPLFILVFGLIFTVAWNWMNQRGIEPSIPVKFALGLIQLGLGFGCLWLGAMAANEEGFVWLPWLILGYLLHTTGELCLSPVGLAMVTKLSPTRLVSTVMGTWFLATAFSQFLAAILAGFSNKKSPDADENAVEFINIPTATITGFMDLFQFITIAAVASGVICLLLSPLLKYWMHDEVAEGEG